MTNKDEAEQASCPIPQKLNQTIVSAVSLAGFITSCLFLKSCNFISTPSDDVIGLFSERTISNGLYVCSSYSSEGGVYSSLSGGVYNSFMAARAMGVIAAIFGGFAISVLTAGTLMNIERNIWKTTGAMLLFSFICQSLTFLVFNIEDCRPRKEDGSLEYPGENQCSIQLGAYLSVSSAVLFFGAGVVILKIPPFESPLLNCWLRSDTKIEASQHTDPTWGTADVTPQQTVKRVKIMPDGSQVVSYESVPV